jgi:hypothetical protein
LSANVQKRPKAERYREDCANGKDGERCGVQRQCVMGEIKHEYEVRPAKIIAVPI